MEPIPVYTFTGFLESGKTKFIQETLEDPRFNNGEATLLILCEEGEVECDISAYPFQNVFLETVDDYDDITTDTLSVWEKKHKAARVLLELNGMQPVMAFYEKMPEHWEIAQELMFADARSILSYNANIRSLVVDKLQGCEMVVFNRVTPGQDIMPFHKLARAVNRNVDIIYEYTDGKTQFDEIVDPLPFDINAPVIEIGDDDYALWYRDISEEPGKYDGKTVKFKGQVAKLRRDKDSWFAPGRQVMTCCVEDIQFLGVPCRYEGSKDLKVRDWVTVTAKIQIKKHAVFQNNAGPVLTALNVEPAEAPADVVCTF